MSTVEKIMTRMSRLLGREGLVTDPTVLDERSWDALSVDRIHPREKFGYTSPFCVALPASTEEVRELVLMANQEKFSLVPYGGGSGLMGAAVSVRSGIVVDLKRMAEVVNIDVESRLVRVQAGCILKSLDQALNEKGLMLGHDPWTYPVATVGGAISTNSLGYRGGKYGSMGDQVLGLEAVMPQGEHLQTRAVPKSSTGIDLKRLMIGGEGCFGIVTEATLRAFPVPEHRSLLAFHFASFEAGFEAIKRFSVLGLRPSLMDFGDDPVKSDDGAVLYLGFEGTRELVQAEERLAVAVCTEAKAKRLPDQDAERFWSERHDIAYRFMHNRKDRRQGRQRRNEAFPRDFIHVALPVAQVLAFRGAAKQIVATHGVRLQESGLWTQPELFSLRLALEKDQRGPAALEDAVKELLLLVQEMAGSMEYCHGVGLKLASLMAREHGQGNEIMGRIKRTLDPNEIMNPGKMGFYRLL